MTKKQLEKYRKEFNEFVANVEKMGGRFLTEDELRYKINGGEGGGGESENSQVESESPSVEGESGEDFDSAPTEATAGGAGETEEVAEEDDDKSFFESLCEAVGGVVDAVGDAVGGLVDTVTDAVSDAAHAVGEFVEDVIDFFTGGSGKADNTVTTEGGSEPANPTNPTVGGSENSKSPDATQDKSTSENGKTNTSGDITVDSKNLTYDSSTGTFRSNPTLSDVKISPAKPEDNLAAAIEAANGKSKETYDDVKESILKDNISQTGGVISWLTDVLSGKGTSLSQNLDVKLSGALANNNWLEDVRDYNCSNGLLQDPCGRGSPAAISEERIYTDTYSGLPDINPTGKVSFIWHFGD